MKIKDVINDIKAQVRRFIDCLRGKHKQEEKPIPQPEPVPVTPQPTSPPIETPTPAPAPVPAPAPTPEDSDEPTVTEPTAQITSFLWKPLSDTSPTTVIVVGCDKIRSEHLRVELFDGSGKEISGKKTKNPGSKRGNKENGYKYGRINFKPGKTASQYAALQPIKVRFFVELNGQRYDIKIQNQDFLIISDAKKRWKAKNGKLVFDPK